MRRTGRGGREHVLESRWTAVQHPIRYRIFRRGQIFHDLPAVRYTTARLRTTTHTGISTGTRPPLRSGRRARYRGRRRGYTIAYAMLLISGARSGDRFGRRRTYLAGVIIFTAASLACALAPDSQALVAFRFVQGAGAAALVPQVFSIIQLTFSGPARSWAGAASVPGTPVVRVRSYTSAAPPKCAADFPAAA